MLLYDANGNIIKHNSAVDITPPRDRNFASERPLAITEHLKIFMEDGEPKFYSRYGLTPLQIEGEIRKWQAENPHHPRFDDSELWLEAYQPKIDAYKTHTQKRLEEIRLQDLLQEFLQAKKKNTENEMKSLKPTVWRETAETFYAALLFGKCRDAVKDLGYSEEEAHKRAIAVVRELFLDRGCSDEEADNKVTATLKAAETLGLERQDENV